MDDPRLRHADNTDAVHQSSVTGHGTTPLILGGAWRLTLADMLVRLLPTYYKCKPAVVTAFRGVSVFIAHPLRERRTW
ncbi:hypothetical protein [Rhizorhabdus phycosphaerae]|uniref:hypothetical protein n=1 Tax=Rhizorhabdus phycosphaerae TaxID=2711156 RepID=UPI0013EE3E6B|nr:hypothetical protein [Rhizorhabdus phycosphaerae]